MEKNQFSTREHWLLAHLYYSLFTALILSIIRLFLHMKPARVVDSPVGVLTNHGG